MPVSKKEVPTCPVDAALVVLDGRWKGTILWRLSDGPMRTSELRRSIPGIYGAHADSTFAGDGAERDFESNR